MDKDCPTLIISKPPENGRKMRKINRFDDPFAILSLLQAPFKSPGKEAEFPFIDSQSVNSENRPVHQGRSQPERKSVKKITDKNGRTIAYENDVSNYRKEIRSGSNSLLG